ncbi:4-hydroxy-3-methylbut-2-en-1-yl diphosphate synthase (ferredoxin) [Asticcacaulis sp. MM231]
MDSHHPDDRNHTHVRPWRAIERRKSRQIMVGKVAVGGNAPITVQSMTNTLTSDPQATLRQIAAMEEAGADIVRVSCPDVEFDPRAQDDRRKCQCADRGGYPLPLQARH